MHMKSESNALKMNREKIDLEVNNQKIEEHARKNE